VSVPEPRARAGLGALLICLSVAILLSGCSIFHRGRAEPGCHERPFTGNAQNQPPLKVPPGVTAPNRTAEIKVPQLDTPAPPRASNAACLDQPPKYVSEPLQPPVRRPVPPPPAPASAPAPAAAQGPAQTPAPTPAPAPAPVQ